MEDFVSLGNLLSPNKQLYATLNMRAWVPQDLKKKVLKQTMNHRMISLALKPQDVYDVKKKDVPTIWKNQNTIFCSKFLFIRCFDMN